MMTDELTKRMKALITLAHYSNEIQLTLSIDFLEDDVGFQWSFTEKLQDSLDCLLKDDMNKVSCIVDGENYKIIIKAKE